MENKKEGIYYLKSPSETEYTLVHGYYCSDMGGQFCFGFNTHDGGSLITLTDLTPETEIIPVFIFKTNILDELQKMLEIQLNDGNWNYDEYMFGLANGLKKALGIIKDEKVELLEAPDKFVVDKNSVLIMKKLSKNLAEDEDYAWGWLCNIAVAAQDEGLEYSASNRAAARFLKIAFGIDMTSNKLYQDTQKELKRDVLYEEAVSTAVNLWNKFYFDSAPDWKPSDNTIGVLSQIDNMICGL